MSVSGKCVFSCTAVPICDSVHVLSESRAWRIATPTACGIVQASDLVVKAKVGYSCNFIGTAIRHGGIIGSKHMKIEAHLEGCSKRWKQFTGEGPTEACN